MHRFWSKLEDYSTTDCITNTVLTAMKLKKHNNPFKDKGLHLKKTLLVALV